MTQLANGETYYLPFHLFDADGDEVTDVTAGNYTWPLQKDGAAVASPSITITNPTGTELLLAFTPSAAGNYTFGRLTHSTSGYSTDVVAGGFLVRTSSVDDLRRLLALPAAQPVATTAVAGDTLYLVRNTDFSVTFQIFEADGETAKDLTGYTFRFAIGYRTAAADVKFHSETSISPDSPAANGQVTISITDTETGDAAFDDAIGADVSYELEGTDSGGLITAFAIGKIVIQRDIPEA